MSRRDRQPFIGGANARAAAWLPNLSQFDRIVLLPAARRLDRSIRAETPSPSEVAVDKRAANPIFNAPAAASLAPTANLFLTIKRTRRCLFTVAARRPRGSGQANAVPVGSAAPQPWNDPPAPPRPGPPGLRVSIAGAKAVQASVFLAARNRLERRKAISSSPEFPAFVAR